MRVWLVIVIFFLNYNSLHRQPKLRYLNRIDLDNFFVFQNNLFWFNMKMTVNHRGDILVAGPDSSKTQLHLIVKGVNSDSFKDYYLFINDSDRLSNLNPMVTSFYETNKHDKYIIVVSYKLIFMIKIQNNQLSIEQKFNLNEAVFRPYRYYTSYRDTILGIHPVYSTKKNNKLNFYGDTLAVDKICDNGINRLFKSNLSNPEFLKYGNTSYFETFNNYIYLASAMNNSLMIYDMEHHKMTHVKDLLPNFVQMDSNYYNSICERFPINIIGSRLNYLLDDEKIKFNYIFKILCRSDEEVWIISKSNVKDSLRKSTGVFNINIVKKTSDNDWSCTYNGFLGQSKDSLNVTKDTYPLNYFNNINVARGNRFFIISNDRIGFNPLGMSKAEFELKLKSGKYNKRLKLYEFEIID